MRRIKHIVFHCTDSHPDATVEGILRYWKEERGWTTVGYHYLILADGSVENLLPIDKISNGVRGHNRHSIHISYMGGFGGIDTRTIQQRAAQVRLAKAFMAEFPDAEVKGHRDFEGVTKDCPCFDVKEWLKEEGLIE